MRLLLRNIYLIAAAMLLLPALWGCDSRDCPDPDGGTVPEGMVEIRPVLSGMFSSIPRDPSSVRSVVSRKYDSQDDTDTKLNNTIRLPHGSTVWLIAEEQKEGETAITYIKKSYAVYNPSEGDLSKSYLVPCTADPEGNLLNIEGAPLYLKEGKTYKFYAISPARKLDDNLFAENKVGFQVKNGESFYANDCRYSKTTPTSVTIDADNTEGVQEVTLVPMVNQTALLKFKIEKLEGGGVHDLDIQPSGIQLSGLQNDSPETKNEYGDPDGLFWHMSQASDDEPIKLQHSDKTGAYQCYDYTIAADKSVVDIDVPVLPMYSISKPVIVVFRLKINGVPTSFEMMLNEKDFKAGYSYGYRGKVAIEENVSVVTWQFVSWETNVYLDVDKSEFM